MSFTTSFSQKILASAATLVASLVLLSAAAAPVLTIA
jgi:hypothetical protein